VSAVEGNGAAAATDRWYEWLLHGRFGGDARAAEAGLRMLARVRDRVLDAANLAPGATLLDVGCGDGLIAFGALDRVGPHGRVIFSDISQPLLDHARSLADEMGAGGRCSFVRAAADDLSALDDASVDAVTTRSVLIYVADKAAAFREFHRVLRPGGRLSAWEPVNRFNATYEPDALLAPPPEEVRELAKRLGDFFHELQPLDSDPMMDFDERDLLRQCEAAGFHFVRIDVRILSALTKPTRWEAAIASAGNPNIPSIAEAMQRIFTDDERARYEAAMRPRFEAGGFPQRSAVAHLIAVKDGGDEAPDLAQ
jgi:ubiquinone/menaquinone biosynthesis C-methylase UbiE